MYTQQAVINSQHLHDFDTVVLHTFANVDRPNAWLVFGRRNSFASQEFQRSQVVSLCIILCSLHGYICQCLLIFTHHSLFQTEYLLTRVMTRLLTLNHFPFTVLTIAIFELSVVPLNKSSYHKTIQPTKMSMQTIATTNQLGGTLKEPILYSRCITLLTD